MKTKKELLDFYGVEIGKKYKITNTDLMIPGKKIFTVVEDDEHYGKLGLEFDDLFYNRSIIMLSACCYEEIKPSILDDVEREYLQKYVMNNPAFKGKVKYITKTYLSSKEAEYIEIKMTNDEEDFACFPCFKKYDMYKGMEAERNYTPQELDLLEDCF